MQAALAGVVALLVVSSACAATMVEPSPPGTRRVGAYPVRVEWDATDADGVVFVGDENVCRVPCTVWLRPSEDARVVQEAPRSAVVALPHIPGLDTYDEPPRILVHPARGHPGAAVGLGVTGALMSAVLVPASIYACIMTSQGAEAGHFQFLCLELALAAVVSGLLFASGLLIGFNSAWPSADIDKSPARKPSVDLRVVPGGVVGRF